MIKTALPFLLLVFCGSVAHDAAAQQLYKSVGPDGKVTFGDKPPSDAKAKVSAMHSYVLRPLEGPPAPDATTASAKASAAPAPESVVTPEIEQTMIKIMELVDFRRRFEPVCAGSAASAKAFVAAHKAWLVRNALYVEQQKRLLMEVVSPSRRARLQAKVGQAALNPPARAGAGLEWCHSVTADLDSGRSDIIMPAMLAIPLTVYRTK